MNPIGASILSVLLIVVVGAPRRWALLGMMAGVLFLTQVQGIEVGGFNIFAVRFLELAGFIRVMIRREFSFANLNKIDHALLLLYLFTPIVYCLRATDGQAYMIGASVDAFLCYFCFRGLIHEMDDFRLFLRGFVLLLAPYALMVLFESATHRNAFAYVGGGMLDWTRGDRFRCVGSFRNPDLLGTLGSTCAPLYIGLACIRRERKLAVLGLGLCLLIVWASNSGGPLCTTAVSFAAWGLWFVRTRMQLVRRAMAGGLILLALVMKAPIWYLLARVSEITGGDGWHRSYLMDVSFQHLNLWWFAGMPVIDTWDWFAYSLGTGADITNVFISFGLNAGLGAIVLLILLLTRAFSDLGKALHSVRSDLRAPTETEFLLWGLGAMLTAHIANWFGITYFDQSYVLWFMQLAALSSISASCIKAAVLEKETVAVSPEAGDSFEPNPLSSSFAE